MTRAVGEAFDVAIGACRGLGAEIVELGSPWTFDWADLSAVLMSEVWAHHREHEGLADRYRPALAEFVEVARSFTDAQRYLAAQARRAQGTWLWEDWFARNDVDLVLEPTLPIVPYGRGPGI